MKNFPQSFEPVGSDSILEQFIQLKNYLNVILSSNEYLKTIEQNLTEEQKAQVRENIGAGSATINVIDNLASTSIADPLSANQGRVLNEKITNDIESLRLSTVSLFRQLQNQVDDNIEDISELFQQSARALKTPIVSPTATELVGIDDNNSQVNISIGNGIEIKNGVISAKSELVKEYNISNGSPNAIISGLDLKPNEIFDIFIICSSNDATDIQLKINGINTGYKYIIKKGYWYDGVNPNISTDGSINSQSFQIGTTWTMVNRFHINLCNIGDYIAIESQETALDSTTNYIRDCSGVVSANTTITSLTFTLSSSTFKSGGKILIFKRV